MARLDHRSQLVDSTPASDSASATGGARPINGIAISSAGKSARPTAPPIAAFLPPAKMFFCHPPMSSDSDAYMCVES